jgi:hypothetical protein
VLTILYALGWTQHSVGSQNIRTMAMIQLLLGNIGMAGGGVNALEFSLSCASLCTSRYCSVLHSTCSRR